MSDAAFRTAKYPGYTTAELGLKVIRHEEGTTTQPAKMLADIKGEIARRAKVAAGDRSVMTDGERLRHANAARTLHFHFYDAGAYSGETQRWVMCNFFSLTDGRRNVGQSQLVKVEEWPAYRAQIEKNGWSHRDANEQVVA